MAKFTMPEVSHVSVQSTSIVQSHAFGARALVLLSTKKVQYIRDRWILWILIKNQKLKGKPSSGFSIMIVVKVLRLKRYAKSNS